MLATLGERSQAQLAPTEDNEKSRAKLAPTEDFVSSRRTPCSEDAPISAYRQKALSIHNSVLLRLLVPLFL